MSSSHSGGTPQTDKDKKEAPDSKTTLNKMPESMAYLFLIDIGTLLTGNRRYNTADEPFKIYEGKEKGYGKTLLSAYTAAFQNPPTRKLSHELIQSIHRVALKHFSEEKHLGTYRERGANFAIPFVESKKHLSPYGTYLGLEDFITTWIKNPLIPNHSITINNKEKGEAFFIFCKNKEIQITTNTIDYMNMRNNEKTEKFTQKHLQLLRSICENSDYALNINCGDEDLISNQKEATTASMQAIFDSYEKQIKEAKSDDEKLRVIVNHIQLIAQEHPFRDGNTRTCNILMNKLAHDEGLPLILLVDPNRIELYDKEKLFKSAKEGQKAYLMLTQGKTPTFDDPDLYYFYNKAFPLTPEKIPVPDAIIKKFMTDVIEKNLQKLQQKKSQEKTSVAFFEPASIDSKKISLEKYNQAIKLYKDKNLIDAIKLLAETIPLFEKSHGPKDTAKAYSTLASFYRDNGQPKDARTCIDTALALYKSLDLKDDHPDVQSVLKKQKDLEALEAKPMQKK